ncbi:MFS transporter [Saccharopolyspora shandongensis]|uniref:MFS transporter n=1 Tax=Saccharopolyspora shandongensis TaxID=418495 RepID=UPI0033F9654D
MTVAKAAPAARSAEEVPAQLWRMAGVLLLGAVLGGLDATIVNVGIDAIAGELRSPLSTIQWVSTGYLLAVSLVMPISGWASERFGAKRMWLVSVALFVGGSALCGIAWSAPALVAFRAGGRSASPR